VSNAADAADFPVETELFPRAVPVRFAVAAPRFVARVVPDRPFAAGVRLLAARAPEAARELGALRSCDDAMVPSPRELAICSSRPNK